MSKVVDFSANFAKMMVDADNDWRAQVPHSGKSHSYYGVSPSDAGNHLNLNQAGSLANPIRQEQQVTHLFQQLKDANIKTRTSDSQKMIWAAKLEKRNDALSRLKGVDSAVSTMGRSISNFDRQNPESIFNKLLEAQKNYSKTAEDNKIPGYISELKQTTLNTSFGATHQLTVQNSNGTQHNIFMTKDMAANVERLLERPNLSGIGEHGFW